MSLSHSYLHAVLVWCDLCKVEHLCAEDHGRDGHGGSSICCPVTRAERSAEFERWVRTKHREQHWLVFFHRTRMGHMRHFKLFVRGHRRVWVKVADPPAPNSPAQNRSAEIIVSWAHNRRGHR